MVGKILAMVGEDIRVKSILNELLESNRSQLEVVKPSAYLPMGERLSFMDVSLRTRRHHVTLVGYFDVDPKNPTGAMIPYINPSDKAEVRVRI